MKSLCTSIFEKEINVFQDRNVRLYDSETFKIKKKYFGVDLLEVERYLFFFSFELNQHCWKTETEPGIFPILTCS